LPLWLLLQRLTAAWMHPIQAHSTCTPAFAHLLLLLLSCCCYETPTSDCCDMLTVQSALPFALWQLLQLLNAAWAGSSISVGSQACCR
jgi:hypothetical protein